MASDRTSCTKATANQFRLLVHTAAYWLLHSLRELAPKTSFWRKAQFDVIRCNLIKVAGRFSRAIRATDPLGLMMNCNLRECRSGSVMDNPG